MSDETTVMNAAEAAMEKALAHLLEHDFASLQTGKASPSLLDGVMVEAYGSKVRLIEVAAVTTPDARTIRIQPWDKGTVRAVEQGIQQANLGLNPLVDGDIIRCPIPDLSKERRQEMSKVASGMAENTRVGMRAARRDAMDGIKALEKASSITEDDYKRLEKEIQKLTDDYVGKINDALKTKEEELLKV